MGFGISSILGSAKDWLTGAGDAEDAIDNAKDEQRGATASSLNIAKDMYGKGQGYLDPYAQFGNQAMPYLSSAILGKPMADGGSFMNQPMSYTGQMQNQAYQRALASRGLLGSGQAAQGIGNIQAMDAERRMQDLWKMLGYGQTANQNLANMATNYGSQVGNINTGNASALGNLYGQQGQLATSYSPWNMMVSGIGALGGASRAGMMG